MKWPNFLDKVRDLPVIETEVLLAGVSDPNPLKVQICRWEKAGKLIQLKRSIYVLSETYRKQEAFGLYIASLLKKPSYVSLEKAFEYHNLIPEAVKVYTCVTPKCPGRFVSKAGVFDYRHIKGELFWGYNSVTVNKQTAFVASPEKALLDFFYLKEAGISLGYLEEMRLQNVDAVSIDKLLEYAKRFKKPGILHAAKIIKKYILRYLESEKTL